jgi:hypothetical protein
MPDAEVKTRLVIEQDGDPQVFRDAATAVRELVAALQSVGGVSFAPLLAQLDQVIAKAKEAAAAVAQVTGQ